MSHDADFPKTISANEFYLTIRGWIKRTDDLWVRKDSFIDTTDKKNALEESDAMKLQKMIDEWADE